MIKGYITFYWSEDNYRKQIIFLHNLKGLVYKGRRPSNYSVTLTYFGEVLNTLERATINEWLQQVPKILRKV